VHRDSGLKAQCCAILEPNTIAQKMSLLSHLLRSVVGAHLGAIATASCAVSNSDEI